MMVAAGLPAVRLHLNTAVVWQQGSRLHCPRVLSRRPEPSAPLLHLAGASLINHGGWKSRGQPILTFTHQEVFPETPRHVR